MLLRAKQDLSLSLSFSLSPGGVSLDRLWSYPLFECRLIYVGGLLYKMSTHFLGFLPLLLFPAKSIQSASSGQFQGFAKSWHSSLTGLWTDTTAAVQPGMKKLQHKLLRKHKKNCIKLPDNAECKTLVLKCVGIFVLISYMRAPEPDGK